MILSFSDSTLRTIITVACVLRLEGQFLPRVACFISMMKLSFNQSENTARCIVFLVKCSFYALVESDSVYPLPATKRGRKCSRFWRVNGAKTTCVLKNTSLCYGHAALNVYILMGEVIIMQRKTQRIGEVRSSRGHFPV